MKSINNRLIVYSKQPISNNQILRYFWS